MGRGASCVRRRLERHRRLNEWQDIIPVRFEILPLIDPEAAQLCLRTSSIETG